MCSYYSTHFSRKPWLHVFAPLICALLRRCMLVCSASLSQLSPSAQVQQLMRRCPLRLGVSAVRFDVPPHQQSSPHRGSPHTHTHTHTCAYNKFSSNHACCPSHAMAARAVLLTSASTARSAVAASMPMSFGREGHSMKVASAREQGERESRRRGV